MDNKMYCAYICNNCKKENGNCSPNIIKQKRHETITWKCANFEPIYLVGKNERARMIYQIFNSKK